MLVELKSGETYNGHLVSCDFMMNVALREVVLTSKDGDRFFHLPEATIRGPSIKYIRIPDNIIDIAQQEVINRAEKKQQREAANALRNQNREHQRGRGGRGGRGRGRGRGGGSDGRGGSEMGRGRGRGGRGGGRGGRPDDSP